MSLLKEDVKKVNYQVVEWMEEITQSGDNFEGLLHHQYYLYDSSTLKEFRDYMKQKRDLW